jgi:hypothetical protein
VGTGRLAPDGFEDTKLRTTNGNANTLKFDSTEFEWDRLVDGRWLTWLKNRTVQDNWR